MKILYVIKQDLDATAKTMIEVHKKGNDVSIVDVRQNKNYDQIVDLIFSNDKIISW